MQFQRDKDLGWAIVFSGFLILVISSLVCAILQGPRKDVPHPVVLANSTFERQFIVHTLQLVKYLSLGAMGVGAYGIIAWPSGPGTPRW
ncbi:MAG: hypothetical protein ACOX34_04215 [Bacillota bacterium]|nr:hypothetical protein [Candidatus Fermentithermobacillaceae bacterium]